MPIDFQALMDIARVNEEEVTDEQFRMEVWKSFCGSVGCLVGNWIMHSGEQRLSFSKICAFDVVPKLDGCEVNNSDYLTVGARLGLSKLEVDFLFGPEFAMNIYVEFFNCTQSPVQDRRRKTRLQNVARVRKFIYWRLRKAEIFADYERARHQEGNWMVSDYAREMAGCHAH